MSTWHVNDGNNAYHGETCWFSSEGIDMINEITGGKFWEMSETDLRCGFEEYTSIEELLDNYHYTRDDVFEWWCSWEGGDSKYSMADVFAPNTIYDALNVGEYLHEGWFDYEGWLENETFEYDSEEAAKEFFENEVEDSIGTTFYELDNGNWLEVN